MARDRSRERSPRNRGRERDSKHERSRADERDGRRERSRDRGRRERDERDGRSKRHRSGEPDRKDKERRYRDRGSSRDKDRKRHRSKSTDKRNDEPQDVMMEQEELPGPPVPLSLDADISPEEIQMMQSMGIPFDFNTTQGQHVDDNASNLGGVKVKQTRRARQYMNRKGGFNRNLPAERTGTTALRD